MKTFRIFPTLLLCIISCAQLPKVGPLNDQTDLELQTRCGAMFPHGKWQFVHSLEAELMGNKKVYFMGVTVTSSIHKTIECVIMTLEGLVLFEAGRDRELIIKRALHPFDKNGFAKGLMKDIQLIFFKPEGPLIESGMLENGSFVCRHQGPEGGVIDIIASLDNTFEIRRYSEDLQLIRTVKARDFKNKKSYHEWPVPGGLSLTAYGVHKYRLTMTLVDAVSEMGM